MAVYKIFPDKDATLYSRYPAKNTGIDEILEVSAKNSRDYNRYSNTRNLYIEKSPYYNYDFAVWENYQAVSDLPEDIRRAVLQFSNDDINYLKTLESGSFQANLKLYLAFAQNLNTSYKLFCYPLNQDWTMGTGRYADYPETRNGVGWKYAGEYENSFQWSYLLGTTSILFTSGGGVWDSILEVTQSFDHQDSKDVNLNITPIVQSWFTNIFDNQGLILKHSSSIELNTSSFIDLKFYSNETHTIFQPYLEFMWDDSVYVPNPSSSVHSRFTLHNELVVNAQNNRGVYKKDSEHTFRIKMKDRYPERTFTTSSIYLNWNYIMEGSQWSIIDIKTNQSVIDFNETYTKISADYNGNFFKVHFKGLHPERYYKILLKIKVLDINSEPLFSNGGSAHGQGPAYGHTDPNTLDTYLNSLTQEQINALPHDFIVLDEDIIFKIVN